MQTLVLGWSCRADAGFMAVMGPSTACAMAGALFSPKARRRLVLASRMVPMPMVMQ